jgi:hypothetical protein
MLATKIRAMFQRKKGRDLFDLYWTPTAHAAQPVDLERVLVAFTHYIVAEGTSVPLAEFIAHLEECLADRAGFCTDMTDLLRPGVAYDPLKAGAYDAGADGLAPSPELAVTLRYRRIRSRISWPTLHAATLFTQGSADRHLPMFLHAASQAISTALRRPGCAAVRAVQRNISDSLPPYELGTMWSRAWSTWLRMLQHANLKSVLQRRVFSADLQYYRYLVLSGLFSSSFDRLHIFLIATT